MSRPQLIAFYLPQFHPIPENDSAWGAGFTEWTNVAAATPRFHGHEQPRLPGELGFYDLRNPEIRERQAELARAHGISAFCYYYYWFDDRCLLSRPLEEVLETGRPDFPFCLCWANEPWSRRWDGSEDETIVAQEYQPGYERRFAESIAPYLADPRYLKVGGRPLLLVYRQQDLPDAAAAVRSWRQVLQESGVGKVFLAAVEWTGEDPRAAGFDAAVEFPPHWPPRGEHLSADDASPPMLAPDFRGTIRDYRASVAARCEVARPPYPRFRGVMLAWDNTARNPQTGMVYRGAEPGLYQQWLTNVLATAADHAAPHPPLVFVNAWNEWAEGTYLEPDARWGSAYLEATVAALETWTPQPVERRETPRAEEQRAEPLEVPAPFPESEEPDVSVVIPVFNHIDLTLECLRSLRRHETGLCFEVVVVDDGSTDATRETLSCLEGVRYLRRHDNRGFGATCNLGATEARGQYLLFLNNDTTVAPGYLDVLHRTFETWPDTGLAGSKILHLDGLMQECGGLLFRDGSAAHFGRGDDPDRPAYRHVRETDYVSGAGMMIRRDLFLRLGGFDRRYEPAYYEDTDLAMQVRRLGLRILVNPEAVLHHHEGATAGTDLSRGVKRFQVVNQRKFLDRWKGELERYPPRPPEPILFANDARRVLVIDWIVPRPNRDAGSLRMARMLELLRELDFHVSIAGHDLECDDQDARPLERLGIEVLRRPHVGSFADYLSRVGGALDTIILSRRDTASQHLAAVRELCPRARLVFDTCDLHFLREEREAAYSDEPADEEALRHARSLELGLMSQADTTLVVSEEEKTRIGELLPAADVQVVPTIHDPSPTPSPFAERQGILFIGFFLHRPNGDAVLWYAREILPRIAERGLRPEFHVIGASPPDEVRALASDQIRVHGFVEDVVPLFDSCRLSVAPLRFGAGVKGKINQSMALGVPCVMTTVGAEGAHVQHGVDGMIADDPERFAECVASAYEDERLWRILRDGGLANIERYFSRRQSEKALRRLLGAEAEESREADATTANGGLEVLEAGSR